MKKLFLTGLIILGLLAAGCSNSDDPINGPEGGQKAEGYLTLMLTDRTISKSEQFNQVGTKTEPGSLDKEQGTPKENKIHDVTIAFTDPNSSTIKFTKTGVKMSAGNPDVTEPVEVITGNYDIYVFVNAAASGVTIGTPTSINTVIEAGADVNKILKGLSGTNSDAFLMTNFRAFGADYAGDNITITSGNDEKNPVRAQVTVDRVVAKIVDKSVETIASTDIDGKTGSAIDGVKIEGFVTLNLNKQFNLLQTWNMDNGSGMTLTANKVLSTPLYTGAAKDQYLNNILSYAKIERSGTDVTAMRDLITENNIVLHKKGESVYVTENRPTIHDLATELTAGTGEATGVIFRTKATKGGTDIGTFWVVSGVFFNDFAKVKALPAFAENTIVQNSDGTTNATALRAEGIQTYIGGVMYYSYFFKGDVGINDFASYKYDGKFYYGVFRNSVYNLNVTKFRNLGDDIPGGGKTDPEDPDNPNPPIDSDKVYIDVEITINDWVRNDVNIEF